MNNCSIIVLNSQLHSLDLTDQGKNYKRNFFQHLVIKLGFLIVEIKV